ncbi:MAG: response regulator [Anaerosacchariphilus sp.]
MIRVLVADEKVCQLICKLIHWEELEMKLVGTASNGIGSLQMIEAEHPDLVMTDIRMPGYDGMELLKRARIQNPDMEFIIISGYSHFEYAQTAIRYGVSDYILKPVNEEALNATLQKVRQRYMEHQVLTEKNLEQKKQQVLDQARVRETLWMDLEYARIPQNMEALNEKYWYHFQEGKFRTFLIQADVKNNENLSENYADNVMELVNSKVPGLFEKLKRP